MDGGEKSVVKILKFLSIRGVEKNLAQLKSAGKIRRIGGRKGGRWEVVEGERK